MSAISCIIYPPTLNYDYLVQRPQQLMNCFSHLNIPVFFLNLPGPGNENYQGIRKVNPHFYLFNNVDPRPFLNTVQPVVYYSSAAHVDLVKKFNPSLVVFDSVDEPSDEFAMWKPYYQRALHTADVVLATSDKLYEMARKTNPHTYLVPNGCDYHHFSQAASGMLPVPTDLKDIARPVIGYIGVVATWCDLQLVERIAHEFAHCSVVMVGPLYNISRVPRASNLLWLGFKPYEQLAAYAGSFDVGIIPFKRSSMIEAVNPIKMWEYMAAGLPVVTTDIPETTKYGDLILTSRNQSEFMHNLLRSLNEDTLEQKTRRMELARMNSWEQRARQIVNIIETRLFEKYGHIHTDFTGIPDTALQPVNYLPFDIGHLQPRLGNTNLKVSGKKAVHYSLSSLVKKTGAATSTTGPAGGGLQFKVSSSPAYRCRATRGY